MTTSRLTRRDLLKTSALAAAVFSFPTIVPSTVFGQNAPSNRINLAAIGCGGARDRRLRRRRSFL